MSVDNKVVKMTFDNAQFQKNVADTMSALDKLKASLNFDKAKASAAGLGDSFKKVDLSPISTQVEGVNAKFLAMAAVATGAIAAVASKAVSAGAEIVKSLALDPVIDGFKEYETNMNSVQTILANTQSKGTTLEDVNAALDEMNEYSDKTIYNFAQMATNVSKFTAAGVGLEQSVSSIKGLANAAALAGVNNEDAQRAMFQLSQALGSGTVKLRDWMSVENSGMSTEQFRNALVQTGQALGTITNVPLGASLDEWQKKNGNFRDTLQDGWLTAEVLTTTLGAMAGDLDALELSNMGFSDEQVVKMVELGRTALASASDVKTATQLFSTLKETMGSGWSQTFRTVVGDFAEAKGLFTNLNNFIGGFVSKASESRNTLLAEWKWFGGRTVLMEGFTRALNAVRIVLDAIGSAFREAFPKKTSTDLYNMTVAFRDFAKKITLNEEGLKRVKQIFTAFFSVLRIGVEIVKGIFRVIGALGSVLFEVVGGFGGAAGSAGDFISKIREFLVDKGGIEGFFDVIVGGIERFGSVVAWVRDKAAGAFDFLKEKTSGKFAEGLEKAKDIISQLGEAWTGLVSIFKDRDFIGLGGIFGIEEDSPIVGVLFNVRDAIASFYQYVTGIDVGGAFGTVIDSLTNFFGALWDKVSSWSSFAEAFDDIRASISAFFAGLFDSTKNVGQDAGSALGNIGETIRNFVTNLWTTIREGLGPLGDKIQDVFDNIRDAFRSAGKFIAESVNSVFDTLGSAFETNNLNKILAIAGTGIVASLTRSFSRLSKDGLKFDFGLEGAAEKFVGALDNLQGAIKSFQNNIRADTLLKIAIAMAILAASIVALTFVDEKKIAISLGAVATGIGTLVAALLLLGKMEANSVKTAALGASILLVAAAVLVLAAAVFVFGSMPVDVLRQGLISVGITLIGLTVMAVALSNASGSFIRASIAIGIMAASLILFAQTIKYFADLDLATLGKSMAILVPMLLGFAVLSNIVDGTAMQRFSIGLGLASISLWALAKVIEKLGSLPFGELIKGLLAMVVVIGVMVASMLLMPDEKKAKSSSLAMIGMAAALWIMAKAIETVGNLATGGVIQAVLALVIVMGLMVVAALALNQALPGAYAMLILAGSLAIFAASLYALGQLSIGQLLIGLAAIAGIFVIFGVAGMLLGPVIPVLLAFGAAVILVGAGFLLFGAGVAAIGGGLYLLSKVGVKAFKSLAKGLIEFVKVLPKIARAVAEALVEIIRVIGESAADIADAIGDLVIALLEKIQELVPVIGETIGVIIDTLLTLMEEKIPRFIEVGLTLLTAFMTGIRDNIGLIVDLGLDILTNFLNGITENLDQVGTAIGNLITEFIKVVTEQGTRILDAGVSALIAFLDAFNNGATRIAEAVGKMVEDFIKAIGGVATRIIDAGVATLIAFLWGLTNNFTIISEEVRKMFDQILLAILDLIINDGGIVDVAIRFTMKFLKEMAIDALQMADFLGLFMVNLINGLAIAVERYAPQIQTATKRLGFAIIDGMTFGLLEKATNLYNKVKEIVGNVIDMAFGLFDSNSPSKVFWALGNYAVDGLAIGLGQSTPAIKASKNLASSTIAAFGQAMSGIKYDLESMEDFNPTITPVLDLSSVDAKAKSISNLFGSAQIQANLSTAQAQSLATAQNQPTSIDGESGSSEPSIITFEQHNHSPKALTTSDIYRGTRSQIATAKEALGIK